MLQNVLTVAGQVFSLFLLMGIGFVLTTTKKVTEETAAHLSYVLMYVVTPCVIIDSMQREKDLTLLAEMGIAAGIFIFTTLFGIAISVFFFRKQSSEARRIYRFALSFSNCGYMGLPLVQSALGESAMIYASAAVIGINLLGWTVGVMLMGGRKEASLRRALINPGTIGFLVGLFLFWFEIMLPAPLASTTAMVASLNTPIAMIVVGCYVAKTNLARCLAQKRLYFVSAMRLVVIPAIVTALVYPLHLPYELYAAAILVSSAPTAALTTIFASRYRMDSALASQCVTLSTLLSILTMPILAAVLQIIS